MCWLKKKQTNKHTYTHTLTVTNTKSKCAKCGHTGRAGEKEGGIRCKVRAELPFGLHKFHYPKRREAATILS